MLILGLQPAGVSGSVAYFVTIFHKLALVIGAVLLNYVWIG